MSNPSKPIQVAPELLAQLAQAKLVAQNAAKDVEILTLRICVRYGLPPGATWDGTGAVTLPPKRGDVIPEPEAPKPPEAEAEPPT